MKVDKERFRLIFEHSPIGIWEEDLSSFVRLWKGLEKEGVENYRKYLEAHSSVIIKAFHKIKIIDVNKAALNLYGARDKKELMRHFRRKVPKGAVKILINEFMALMRGDRFFQAEFKNRTLAGKQYDVLLRVSVPAGYEKSLSRVIVTLENISDRKRLEARLKKMAQMDGLTKLYNQRAITQRLKEEWIRAKRYSLDLSCLMIDLDYFKIVNDKFGHQRGDQVLRRVASLLREGFRKTDIVGRYGGDEFFVILTQTNITNAQIAAERVKKFVASHLESVIRKMSVPITLSFGVSGYPSQKVKDYGDLIAQADKALYVAKAAGRDRIVNVDL